MRFFPRVERMEELDAVCSGINEFIFRSDERHSCDSYEQFQAHVSISENTETILMGEFVVYDDMGNSNDELSVAACLREFASQLRPAALLCGTIETNYPAEHEADVA